MSLKVISLVFFSVFLFSCSHTKVLSGSKTGGSPSAPVINKNQNNKQCPIFKQGNNRITKSITLPKGCQYHYVNFILDKNKVTFDCNGTILNGLRASRPGSLFKEYSQKNKPRGAAFLIKASDITVKNCRIKNYVDGIRIRSRISKKAVKRLRSGDSTIEKQLRAEAPKNIKLVNLDISNSHKHGIFIERYIKQVKVDQSRVKNSGNSGIYLESGTQNITITRSQFVHNGYVDYRNRIRYPKLAAFQREAIAIDSSANNVIANNTFENNGGGGIFLYKNCFEHHKQGGQLPRFQHSNNNLIQGNTFLNEDFGIRVAARQSRNLVLFECGDPLVARIGLFQKYYEDFAKNNRIIDNTFINVTKGVTVEDDNTVLQGNRFSGRSLVNIQIGTPYRTRYKNRPVKGTILENNRYNSTAPEAVKFIYQSKKG